MLPIPLTPRPITYVPFLSFILLSPLLYLLSRFFPLSHSLSRSPSISSLAPPPISSLAPPPSNLSIPHPSISSLAPPLYLLSRSPPLYFLSRSLSLSIFNVYFFSNPLTSLKAFRE